MLGNNVSLFLGVIEMMIFANIFYGIPFVQRIFTGQKIFMEEYCTVTESSAGEYCPEASAMVGTMWTIGTIFSCSGPIIFGTLQTLIGSHWTRVIAGSLTSTGLLLMSFYESSAYYLLVGVTFVAFPSISYIILNSFVAPVYKSITTPLIVMIPGLINSSATSMLVAKKLYEAGLPLNKYFLILFILSFVIHIRTLFFIPSVPIPKPLEPPEQPPGYVEPKFNMMKSAIAVELFCKNKKEKEIEKENPPAAQKRPPIRDHLPQMKNWIYPIYGVYYTIITFRINTIKGWMTSWIQHAYRSLKCSDFQERFSDEDCLGEIENSITFLIDINGYTYFFLAVIPFLPAFLIKFFARRYPKDYHFGELRTKLNALLIQMTFCIAVTIGCSIMMTYQASAPDSRALALTLIFSPS
ncbi:Oidioi.mRNA.OKI2018_I69.PAR.g9259.t1.cds [Oikopleura dioica]|uniref:Oidioi.mRNA.OKI2018_I69.PAR.g9259.t1.cds n=1 Tax=Oikopleura dioica TaxID=34765 RepID=A0ABN7RND3_OIKDI|nr:Oidioi.mRNA.OKI2018_I69.PAR.g9259.t1.cds [Oikopleura dioica]